MAKIAVAPLVGAWIEIFLPLSEPSCPQVAPLVGAWIEIFLLPHRQRTEVVAPLVGAWIEIMKEIKIVLSGESRSPRGSVD